MQYLVLDIKQTDNVTIYFINGLMCFDTVKTNMELTIYVAVIALLIESLIRVLSILIKQHQIHNLLVTRNIYIRVVFIVACLKNGSPLIN